MGFVGKGTEKRKHDESKHVVYRHDLVGGAFADSESVFKDERNNSVIGLPESADRKKGKANKKRAFIVEFHFLKPPEISQRPQ